MLRDWKSVRALIHYYDSPVGPYNEYAIIQLKREGPIVTEMYVDSADSQEAGRALWGFPKVLADLEWRSGGSHLTFRKGAEYFRIWAFGFALPVRVRTWTIQVLEGAHVRVPIEVTGRVGLGFRRRQIAFVLEDFEMKVFAPQAVKAYTE